MRSHTLFIAIAALIAALLTFPAAAQAFSPWEGRITANVNLRAAPGLNGRIITGLDRGATVRVRASQGQWLQIERQTDTFGYIGWVYGQYVAALDAPAEPVSAPAPAPVPAPPAVKAATPVVQSQATSPAPVPRPQAPVTPVTPAVAASPPSAPPVAAPAAATATPAPRPVTPAPAKARPAITPDPGPAPSSAPAQREEKPMSAVAATAAREPAPAEIAPPNVSRTVAAAPFAGPRAIVGLVLRLATTLLASLALILSFRAYRLARETALQTVAARSMK